MIPAGEQQVKNFRKGRLKRLRLDKEGKGGGGGVLLTFHKHQKVKTIIMKNQIHNLRVCVSQNCKKQKIHSLLGYNFVFSLVGKI